MTGGKRYTTNEFLQKVKDVHGDKFEILGEYIAWNEKIEYKCNNCQFINYTIPYGILKMKGCRKCYIKNIPNRGVPVPEEMRNRISSTLKGKYASGEIAVQRGFLGKKHTEEAIEKIRASSTGRPNPRKGKKRPPEEVERLKGRSGPKSHKWQGGLTEISKIVRNSVYYINWRDSVYKRDNYTCLDCGKRGGDLNAHHLIRLSYIVKSNNIKSLEDAKQCDLLWNIDNGVTLCEDCHIKRHEND